MSFIYMYLQTGTGGTDTIYAKITEFHFFKNKNQEKNKVGIKMFKISIQ